MELFGAITWIPRIVISAILLGVNALLTQLIGPDGSGGILTPEDIIFSGKDSTSLPLLSVNFFDINGTDDSLIKSFRSGVAQWYSALRSIAIVASLAVLIYIGIRMAISSVASEKAMYKQMLKDWLVGFAILFFLHYIMIIVIQLNSSIVSLIYNIMKNMGRSNGGDFTTITGGLQGLMFSTSLVKGFMATILYGCFIVVTITFFIMYMKRLFTVGFLIVISPLITITYSIDKLGDGKSQALDTWTKEFVYNILIQPFHCILYVVFASAAVEALCGQDGATMANFIFAILALTFMIKAENIIKKIFGFEKAGSVEGMAAAGALAFDSFRRIKGARQKATGRIDKGSGSSGSGSSGGIHRKTGSNIESGNSNNNGLGSGGTNGAPEGGVPGNDAQTGSGNDSSSESGVRTSTTSTPKARTAIGRAAQETLGNIKDSIDDFRADKLGTIGELAGKGALYGGKAVIKGAAKVAVGSMASVATGNIATGALVGYAYSGGRFTSKISSYADEDIDKMKENTQKRRVATAYRKYMNANSNMSDDEGYNKAADLLEVDPDRVADPTEANLAKQLQKMQALYQASGADNADVKAMNVIEDVQLGNIKNRISINENKMKLRTEAVGNAAEKFKKSESGKTMSADEIREFAKTHMEKMDTSGKKYNKEKIYTELSKDKKVFVKEIQKSKEVQKALSKTTGKNISNEEINEQLIKEIEDRLN